MSYIQSVYINALLADASYIDLPIGKVDADSERYKELSTRMTPLLSKFIVDNFEVARLRAGSRRFRPMACMRKAARAKRAGGHGQQDGRKAECAAYFAPFLIA
ncbi:hypothetical protein [uncultured Ottowia sp.]|uniref:hypothetical protein n=1 Tax=uncultured Ottowia sp. TaxID=543067 RepID=UPI002592F056|nr:hypothetical protein [uncultured Ottowia sp.]